jgi:hypothetical protein
MNDLNSSLLKAYYNVLTPIGVPVYEGEEPDDVKDEMYIVLHDVINSETSTANSLDFNYSIQISIHNWKYKYNNSSDVNGIATQIINAIKSQPTAVLDMSADGFQMMNLFLDTDRTERIGEMGGRVYISRILIFKQDIFVIS